MVNQNYNCVMENWDKFFDEVKTKQYAIDLKSFLDEEYAHYVIYPPRKNMFKAFELVPPEKIKVVIIGQDPYHEENQAMGLSFSVPRGEVLPPSLRNIYKEIQNDVGTHMINNGDLTYLANQGVFLINAYLSVRAHQPLSHKNEYYEQFMGDLMAFLNKLDQPIVYLLWGGFAQKFSKYLNNPKHLVLKSAHPSPLSANRGGWFDTHQFSKTNDFLINNGLTPIDWQN